MYENDSEIAPIIKDIANAKQGVLTFSKEVKKYMLQFIHEHYDENPEVQELIQILRSSNRYESYAEFEIFKLQDESFFWYDFLNCYALWKIIQKKYGKMEQEDAIKLLVRLIRFDIKVFDEYKNIQF
ncbi:MAG: hypothetical protein PHE93_03200 [Clostridia bacterium]|nr:hypothetical protein [Clostridia bacterium]